MDFKCVANDVASLTIDYVEAAVTEVSRRLGSDDYVITEPRGCRFHGGKRAVKSHILKRRNLSFEFRKPGLFVGFWSALKKGTDSHPYHSRLTQSLCRRRVRNLKMAHGSRSLPVPTVEWR